MKELINNFWANGEELKEEKNFKASLKILLREVRNTLQDSSNLAKSIDRGDSPKTMAKISIEENFTELAEILIIENEQIKA